MTLLALSISLAVLVAMALHGHVTNRKRLDSLNRHYREDFDK